MAETDFPDNEYGLPQHDRTRHGSLGRRRRLHANRYTHTTFWATEITFQDQNGTTHSYKLDALGRGIGDSVAFYSGNPFSVDNTVMSLGYSFNDAGLHRHADQLRQAADESGTVVNQEKEAYDGLQQLATDYSVPKRARLILPQPRRPSVTITNGDGEMAGTTPTSTRSAIRTSRVEDYAPGGANQEPVTGISVSGTAATVTTAAADGLTTGAIVDIQGSSVSALDGVHTLTSGSGDTFAFTVTGGTASDTSSTDMTEVPTSSLAVISSSRPDRRNLRSLHGDTAGVDLQSYTFLGLGTIVQEKNGNGVELTYMQQSPDPTPTPTTIDSSGDRYPGLDRFDRVVDQNWIIPTPTPTTRPAVRSVRL